ncbi:MAG: hypothetical protein ACQER9_02700 [Nanobdellota archaeon]
MRTIADKIKLLKDDNIKKRFRIITRKNKDSPAANYGCVYRTYRKPESKYPINDTIIVFSKKLRDKDDMQKVIEDCTFWGRNHGEMHMAVAVKPLIEEFFERKKVRDEKKQKRYDEFKKKMDI